MSEYPSLDALVDRKVKELADSHTRHYGEESEYLSLDALVARKVKELIDSHTRHDGEESCLLSTDDSKFDWHDNTFGIRPKYPPFNGREDSQ